MGNNVSLDEYENLEEKLIKKNSNKESKIECENEKSLKSNSFFYLIYSVINVLFPFVTAIYVARVLLPSGIGQVETARNLVQYFSILAFLGIPTYGLREISKVRYDKLGLSKLFSELYIVNFISTVIFGTLYLLLILSVPVYRANLTLYMIVGISIFINFFNVSWLYEGLEEFKFISIRNIIFKVVTFILLILFVREESDFINYAVITIIGTTGNYLFDFMLVPTKVKFTVKGLNIKRHIKSILFLATVNLAIELYSLVDVTMLGIMTTDETVAFYSYGLKVYKILLQVINSFTMVLVPRIAIYYKMGKIDFFNELLTRTLRIICIISIPAIVGIWFVSDYIMVMMYGEAYIQSAYILKILSFNLIISPIGYLLGSRVMLVTGNENKMIIPVGVGAIVNIVLNFILINLLEHEGAALASVISEIVVMIIYITLSHDKFKINRDLKPTLIKTISSSLIMASVLFGCTFIPISDLLKTIIRIVAAILTYGICLIVMKENLIINIFKKE